MRQQSNAAPSACVQIGMDDQNLLTQPVQRPAARKCATGGCGCKQTGPGVSNSTGAVLGIALGFGTLLALAMVFGLL